jgi:gliding motility-associated lipoprotein GldH
MPRALSRLLAAGFAACLLAACQPNYLVHEYRDFPQGYWAYDSAAVFEFSVEQAQQPYDLYYRLRNTRDYPFYNLYVRWELLDEAGSPVREQLQEVHLMHPQTGKPLGNGESLYDHAVPALEQFRFEKPGRYRFRLQQYMRLDSLPGLQAVGFSLLAAEGE